MIMQVRAVVVGRHNKGVLALEKPFGKLVPELVRFLRCDLSRLERLAYLVGDHVAAGSLLTAESRRQQNSLHRNSTAGC